MNTINKAILGATDAGWISKVRVLAQRSDNEIYCFASPSDETAEQDRYPYMPVWLDLSHMSKAQAVRAAAFLGAPLVRGDYNEMVGVWDMSGRDIQVTISNRLANKIDTIN